MGCSPPAAFCAKVGVSITYKQEASVEEVFAIRLGTRGGIGKFQSSAQHPQNTPTPLLAVCGAKRKHADPNIRRKLRFLLASAKLPDLSGIMRTAMDMKPGSGGGTRTPDTRIMIPLL